MFWMGGVGRRDLQSHLCARAEEDKAKERAGVETRGRRDGRTRVWTPESEEDEYSGHRTRD